METFYQLFTFLLSQPSMGNTGAREKSQQSVDDSGPTLLQSPIGYNSRAGEDYPSSNRVINLQIVISFPITYVLITYIN